MLSSGAAQAGQERPRDRGQKAGDFCGGQRENGMGFRVARLVERVNSEQVRKIAMRISAHSEVRTDAFKALQIQGDSYRHESKATSLKKVNERLRRFYCHQQFQEISGGNLPRGIILIPSGIYCRICVSFQSLILGISVAGSIAASHR